MNIPEIKAYYGAEKIIIAFYFFINVVSLAIMNKTSVYIGDQFGVPFDADAGAQLIYLCFVFFYFMFFYILYKAIVDGDKHSSKTLNCLEVLFFVGTLLGWIGFFFFSYGKAEYQSNMSFGFIFRIIPYDVFFGLYIASMRKINKRSSILILFYVSLKLAMGWSGFFVPLFWIFFIRVYNSKARTFCFSLKITFFILFMFLLSPYVYYLKFYIRYGFEYDFNYFVIMSKLIARLSVLPNAIFVYENSQQFIGLAKEYLSDGFFFLEPIVAILPRSLLGLGGQNLETLYIYLVTSEFNPGVIFYLGYLGKLSLFYNWGVLNLLCFFFYSVLIVVVLFLLITKAIFRNGRPVAFCIMLQFLISGSMEEISYSLYGLCFLLFFSMLKVGNRVINRS
ncbi:oligosaccharide repeat unit polymerase [Aeromonas caviae]